MPSHRPSRPLRTSRYSSSPEGVHSVNTNSELDMRRTRIVPPRKGEANEIAAITGTGRIVTEKFRTQNSVHCGAMAADLPARVYQLVLQQHTGLALAFEWMTVIWEPQFCVEFNGATWTGALPQLTTPGRPNVVLEINVGQKTVTLLFRGQRHTTYRFTL